MLVAPSNEEPGYSLQFGIVDVEFTPKRPANVAKSFRLITPSSVMSLQAHAVDVLGSSPKQVANDAKSFKSTGPLLPSMSAHVCGQPAGEASTDPLSPA